MKKELTFILLIFLIAPTMAQELLDTPALTGQLEDQTENLLQREIPIPPVLHTPFRIIFGIKNQNFPISIERFTVLLAVWIMFFTILQGVMKIAPIFHGSLQKNVAAVIVTILIAITGAMDSLVRFFFDLGDTFEWMAALGPFQILLGFAIASVIIWVGHYVTHYIETKYALASADYARDNLRTMKRVAEITSKSID